MAAGLEAYRVDSVLAIRQVTTDRRRPELADFQIRWIGVVGFFATEMDSGREI